MLSPQVAIVMGSDSDLAFLEAAVGTLRSFGISHEVRVISAHRSPARLAEWVEGCAGRGVRVIIAGAGWAAHLAGVCAASTILPVIGVPIPSSPLQGLDALLATVQMPGGVPVASMALGEAGAKNAAVFAAEILALSDEKLREKLQAYKRELASKVEAKDDEVRKRFEAKPA
ncbi:5-(carboxyamino)imidazole ribonucleotide mutase [bacterium]|nr:5-(carboxyamino)imidazole ribonucleotide mutase [bacterium]